MSKKAARLGDTGSGHGCFPPTPITGGSPDIIINGRPAARVGDALLVHGCGDCPSHERTITEGSSTVFFNGKPAARVGDAIDCGGVIIGGSGNVFIGDTPYTTPDQPCLEEAKKAGAVLVQTYPEKPKPIPKTPEKDWGLINSLAAAKHHEAPLIPITPSIGVNQLAMESLEGQAGSFTGSSHGQATTSQEGNISPANNLIRSEKDVSSSAHLTKDTLHVNLEEDRKQSIINNTPAIFDIKKNPNADSSEPLIEIDLFDEVDGNEAVYEDVAKKVGIDANLLKTIAYLETTHGYYDRFTSGNKSFRPMNIYYEIWKDLCNEFGYNVHDIQYNKKKNIHVGAVLLKRIQDRIENPTVEKVASIYNFLGAEKTRDYGARARVIYAKELWKNN